MNDDDIPVNDEHTEDTYKNDEENDPEQQNESDFDHEVDDSDSDHSVIKKNVNIKLFILIIAFLFTY